MQSPQSLAVTLRWLIQYILALVSFMKHEVDFASVQNTEVNANSERP